MATGIILARGGSKGVRLKNLRVVGGKTLLARAIETTLKADGIERVIVSSDLEGILQEAREHGADTVERPAELATDEATSQDGLRHVIEAKRLTGPVALVQCTNPFMAPEDVAGVLDWQPRDMAVVVTPWHGLVVDDLGFPVDWVVGREPRQDRPARWLLAGSAWGFSVGYVMERQIYDGRMKLVEAKNLIQVDIDTEEELTAADKLLYEPTWGQIIE